MDTVADYNGSDVPEVDSTPLGVDDLYDLKKELNKVSAKWYDIGIALRLDPDILTGIQDSNIGQPSSCLRSMLTEWLKQNYNVKKFGEPTWQWVVDAVGDPAGGGHMALARDIARRHKPRAMSGVCLEGDRESVKPEQTCSGKPHKKVAQPIAGPPAISAGGEAMDRDGIILGARHKLSGEQKKAAADTEKVAKPIGGPPAISAGGEVMDKDGKTLGTWHELSSERGRHTLTLGTPSSEDVVLHDEKLRKGSEFLSKVSHTFSYNCRRGEEITAVLAYDVWSDDTGGYPERKSGGVGQDSVSIRVTSQYGRGFHFKFIVYGKR